MGYKKFDLKGVSWYNLLHPECIKEVQSKHRLSKLLQFNFYYSQFFLGPESGHEFKGSVYFKRLSG